MGCFFQCISQRWFSVWASRWPAIGLTCTRPPTLHCGEHISAPVRSSQHFWDPTAELCSGFVLFFCRPPGSEHQVLNPWVTINLVVALLVGLAWIFIGFRPEKDYTEGQWEGAAVSLFSVGMFDLSHVSSSSLGYLMTMEIGPPKPQDKSEMNAWWRYLWF